MILTGFGARPPRGALRHIGRSVLHNRNLGQAWRSAVQTVQEFLSPQAAPYYRSTLALAEWSQRSGFAGDAFYFMAATPAPYDGGYDLGHPALRRSIAQLQALGCEIGIHPGYHTLHDPQRLQQELQRFQAQLGIQPQGGRQHYLRFAAPATWRAWQAAGLQYDSTLGFADHEGFRCGTCHPYPVYDSLADQPLALQERPLIVMDSTLIDYRALQPSQALPLTLNLARRCAEVEGDFILLWHNTLFDPAQQAWSEFYAALLAELPRTQEAARGR